MAPLLDSTSGLLFLPPSSLASASLGISPGNGAHSSKLEGEIKQLVADICADRDRPFGGLLLKVIDSERLLSRSTEDRGRNERAFRRDFADSKQVCVPMSICRRAGLHVGEE